MGRDRSSSDTQTSTEETKETCDRIKKHGGLYEWRCVLEKDHEDTPFVGKYGKLVPRTCYMRAFKI